MSYERASMGEGEEISCLLNPESRKVIHPESLSQPFSLSVAQTVRSFHASFPRYRATPLVSLAKLAQSLGVAEIWIKDESYRFGLNAFKVLGATYAIACMIARKLGISENNLSFDAIYSGSGRETLAGITLVTATDGNHGRAVAWAAQTLGINAVVYMPRGSVRARVEAVNQHGAKVVVVRGNYDDAVRVAAEQAELNDWMLVQDSAWEGYEEIPIRITQGYLTILHEAFEQLRGETPSHVFVQCGVGSLAASVQAYLVESFGSSRPICVVVEPKEAGCFYESMSINDGNPHKVSGDLKTIMAGLACGEPGLLGWKILRAYTDGFAICSDSVAIKGMRTLARPLPGDDPITSGESGAVTTGLVATLLGEAKYREIVEALSLTRESRILLLSTEGDTDPEMYQKIVHSSGE
jgi:diaminopropionate ammonia-lyase